MEVNVSRGFFHKFIQCTNVDDLFLLIDTPMFTIDGEPEELEKIKQASMCPFEQDHNYVTLKSFINGFLIPLTDQVFVTYEPKEAPGTIECNVVEKWWNDNDEPESSENS